MWLWVRKTHEAIGFLLSGRTNIVLSRDHTYQGLNDNARVFMDLDVVIQYADTVLNETELFIIGGAEIYNLALPHATKIYLTRVHDTFDGDTHMFDIDREKWKETSRFKVF